MAECILIEERVSFKLDGIQRKGFSFVILCKEQVKLVDEETGQTRLLNENLRDFFTKGSGRRGLKVEWMYTGGPLGDTPRRRMQLQDVKMGVKVSGAVVHDLLKFFGEGLRLKFILSQSEIDIPSRPNGPDSEPVESGEISYVTDPTLHQHHFFNSKMLVPDKWRKHWSLQSGTTFSTVFTIKMSGDVILKEIPTRSCYSLDEAPPEQSFSMKDLLIHMEKDAVILPKDNSFRFECHQALLKACSPKLVELIDRLRKDGDVVMETSMSKEGVAEFLTFIEDGTLSLAKKDLSVALEMLAFSSLHSIEKLTNAGVHAVLQYREMDAKNAIELFKFAQHMHPSSRSELLEKKSMEMVKRIGGFFCSEDFISLVSNDNKRAALLQRRFKEYFRV